MEIGSKLKNARNEMGITQEQAAELLGVSRQTVSNWENNKSYPDIISVIKMSDVYSVSLDRLLKEEKSVNQTYREFLEESTNTVKAKRNLGKTILLSTYFLVWLAAMLVFWQVNGPLTTGFDIALRWILLPLLLFAASVTVAKNDYWGNGNWFCVIGAAATFLTIPYTAYAESMVMATFTFIFPNFMYMAVGIAVSVCGLAAGMLWRKKFSANEKRGGCRTGQR